MVSEEKRPAIVLDLDGTLVDSVYQHVMAWRRALAEVGIPFSVWQVHRRIGMSGGLLIDAVSREAGREISESESRKAKDLHDAHYATTRDTATPLPGAVDLLQLLQTSNFPWAIATSGSDSDARAVLPSLGLSLDQTCLLTSDNVSHAKPDPELFLAAVDRLQTTPANTFVLGDSVWDMLAARRAGCIGIGVMSGGFSKSELMAAHAFRVYSDCADFIRHLDEVGINV